MDDIDILEAIAKMEEALMYARRRLQQGRSIRVQLEEAKEHLDVAIDIETAIG